MDLIGLSLVLRVSRRAKAMQDVDYSYLINMSVDFVEYNSFERATLYYN